MSLDSRVRFGGRILYLTDDLDALRAQLDGTDLPFDPGRPLMDNVSTDELTPGWVCFHYDETLGRYCLVGLRGGVVTPDAIASGGFEVIVSGLSKGCGSSRETAPFSEKTAGVRLVIARSLEKIYRQNCQNIGVLTSTDFSLIPRIVAGEAIDVEEFTRDLDPISAEIVRAGGLFAYNRTRLARADSSVTAVDTDRPRTMVEKILEAKRTSNAHAAPGESLFVEADLRFSHEYVTPMADALFRAGFGDDARVRDPHSVVLFRDHLTFLSEVMPQARRKLGLLDKADALATVQERFAARHGIRLFGESERGGSHAICHNAMIEQFALPGMIVVGTDSHTCMIGVLGCLAFGVGATDMANAWFTRDVRVGVPRTVRVELRGRLRPGTSAKDVMLELLRRDFIRNGGAIGSVLEYGGEGIADWSVEERATLTNMSVEAGAMTGILEPDEVVLRFLEAERGITREELVARIVRSDAGAAYLATIDIDLSAIEPMVALPADPRNGVPARELEGKTPIDIAYGGSCTGGKTSDMDMYATVFRAALDEGRRVAPGVRCYVQFGSQRVRAYAEERGYLELFEAVGVSVIGPSCGACINAGPGASERPEQVTVSAQNRNFPGRSGPGSVYLASPYTVAASAILGYVASCEPFLRSGAEAVPSENS